MLTEFLTWEEVMRDEGAGLVPMVMRVLRGEGTEKERNFVWMEISKEKLLAIAIANAGNFRVTVEKQNAK